MKVVLKTPEGKKVVVNEMTDPCLYEAPSNPPNTGTRYTSGTDLYAHKARSGNIYFYTHSWSMWQGAESEFSLISKEKMESKLVDLMSECGEAYISDSEEETIDQYFPGIFEEDA